jgi:hypothetical protein
LVSVDDKIKALKTLIKMKQRKKKHLQQRTGDLFGDIEYAQDELDQKQEEYDKYVLTFKPIILGPYLFSIYRCEIILHAVERNLGKALKELVKLEKAHVKEKGT